MVGAVVVNHGTVVGEGYHQRCGEAHAEVIALDQAGREARGATMYVSLEPCSHHGRTPPCVDQIVAGGVRRVVIPSIDPDERVSGRGVNALRAAGIAVDIGCEEAAAVTTNLGYYKHRLSLEPTVVLKMAVTADGKIATRPGQRDDVTGTAAKQYVHRLRALTDGVAVGLRTAIVDDPRLDCRLTECGRQPVPVVFDEALELPVDNRWAREGRTFIVVGGKGAVADRGSEYRSNGGRVLACESAGDLVDVRDAVDQLAGEGVQRLLVEGGASVFSNFLREDVWDALYVFHSPKLFGDSGVSVFKGAEPFTPDAVAVDAMRLDGDFLHRYLNRHTYEQIVSRMAEST
jgi:diaminohydroxyphosphoribosylaminopyrimidine deaminase/5-amino-6-(5-phosphoribosylamino)uracil reductase